jgi:hypothetical protein
MGRSGWTLSIVPNGDDQNVYLVLDDFDRSGRMDKRKKTAAELEEIVKERIGPGDFKVTVHRNPETRWHVTIYGRQPAEVHRCQVMADTIATELCQHYGLDVQ